MMLLKNKQARLPSTRITEVLLELKEKNTALNIFFFFLQF